MSRAYKFYVQDILSAIDKVLDYVEGLAWEEFRDDNLHIDGVLFNLMIIGEAAKNLPDEIRNLNPQIEWSPIIRFRDYVAHHYWGLNLDKVWEITQKDLPPLRIQIAILMQKVEDKTDD